MTNPKGPARPAVEPRITVASGAVDFSPGLLGIQENPPAAMPRAVLRVICGLVLLLFVWAWFGKLDIVASAEGRLVPQGYRKIMQPADAGIVQQIQVREGEQVEAGQVLMRMDASITDADARAIHGELEIRRMQLRRIDAELAGENLRRKPKDDAVIFAAAAARQAARVLSYQQAIAQEQSGLDKARHDLQAAAETQRKLQESVPAYRRSAQAFGRLGNEGFFSPIAVDEKQRELMEKEQDLRAQMATVASLQANLAAARKRLDRVHSGYRSELHDERADADSQFRRLDEERHKIDHRSARLALRAPQRGIIKDVAAHAPGTVVAPGTVLMTLIPLDVPLLAEIHILNEDAGFVRHDQRVRVKLSAYPFQKYGMLEGTIIHIGPDAADTPQPIPATGEADNASAAGFRYRALVQLDTQHLVVNDNKPLALTSGMTLTAEIHLGRRTVMEYLLSPVQKAWQEAGRER